MSDNPESTHERAAIQHMMRRLDGFARGLGLDEASTRQIVGKVYADMPVHTDEERLATARERMIVASPRPTSRATARSRSTSSPA